MKTKTLSMGFAIFSMFFGSGNLIFPISLAVDNADWFISSFSGLFITAVFLPFLSYLSIVLYGDHAYQSFQRIGKIPGMVMFLLVAGLLGPLAIVPRCLVLANTAVNQTMIETPPFLFLSIISLALFLVAARQRNFISILGKYLTPFMLLTIAAAITLGLFGESYHSLQYGFSGNQFISGALEGYNTLDIFAALAFSSLIIREAQRHYVVRDQSSLRHLMILSGAIGFSLLGLVYFGLGFVASRYATVFEGHGIDTYFLILAKMVFGDRATQIVGITVCIACFTTAVSLIRFFSDAICLVFDRWNFENVLAVSTITSLLFALMGFSSVQAVLIYAIQLTMPSVLAFIGFSLLKYYVNKDFIKFGSLATFVATLLFHGLYH